MAQTPIPGSNPLRPVEGPQAQPGAKNKAAGAESTDSPAFRVLLEKLQQQARELEARSGAVDAPERLAEAVDIARASLDDALSLSDQLLESFRSAQLGPQEDEEERP